MVSLCKAHHKLGSMTFVFDLTHLVSLLFYGPEQSYKHVQIISDLAELFL